MNFFLFKINYLTILSSYSALPVASKLGVLNIVYYLSYLVSSTW